MMASPGAPLQGAIAAEGSFRRIKNWLKRSG
jgi:hypothetical protein